MEYTVQKLADLAGVSPRTIRYYDEIGLLKPARINSSGYRIYEVKEVDRLQQILFYWELDVDLENIKKIMNDPDFNDLAALKKHREKLRMERERLDLLLANVEKTIKAKERGTKMSDKEKFAGFIRGMVEENERKYGKEAREKYGEEVVERSNQKVLNMTEKEYKEITGLEKEFMETLLAAFKKGDPAGELAQKAADLHRQWLTFYWDNYSEEAHAGVTNLYVADERFKDYYESYFTEKQPGIAEFLREAVHIYTGMDKKNM